MIICKFELIKLGVSVDTWDWNLEFSRKIENFVIFRLDALALSVIATATCLAGWVAGCPSHSGIVSKRLNLSENFSTIWKPHHSSFLRPLRRYKIPRGTPSAGR